MYRQVCKVAPILPDQFWTLSPFEAGCLVKGGAFREEQAWDRAAFISACAMNPHLKKPVTAAQLLGKKEKIVPRDPGAEQAEKEARLKGWLEKLSKEQ